MIYKNQLYFYIVAMNNLHTEIKTDSVYNSIKEKNIPIHRDGSRSVVAGAGGGGLGMTTDGYMFPVG